MGLKSIHEARKIQNELENSSDSQLIKEQMNLIGELQEQISKLFSEKSILLNELQKKSQKIISLNEQIGRLAESDLVLKRNEQLEKQNARLEREKQEAIQKADTVAQNCKAEYEQKFAEVERQKKQVEAMKESALIDTARQNALIQRKAEAISKEKMKTIEKQYKAKIAGYEGFMVGSLLYGTLCTLFTAVRSRAFISDFKTFFQAIWTLLQLCAEKLVYGAEWAAQAGNMIHQPTIAAIIRWLIQIVVVAAVAGGAGFLLFVIARKLYEGYKENFADQISLAELLISFAVVVFFAEPLRSFLPINLFLLLILTHVLYIGIRQYIKGWRRARGYY